MTRGVRSRPDHVLYITTILSLVLKRPGKRLISHAIALYKRKIYIQYAVLLTGIRIYMYNGDGHALFPWFSLDCSHSPTFFYMSWSAICVLRLFRFCFHSYHFFSYLILFIIYCRFFRFCR